MERPALDRRVAERERLTEAVTPYVIDAAGVQPGQRICDIGCGGGGLTIALGGMVGPGGEVVGYDLSAALLELAACTRRSRRACPMSASSRQTSRSAP